MSEFIFIKSFSEHPCTIRSKIQKPDSVTTFHITIFKNEGRIDKFICFSIFIVSFYYFLSRFGYHRSISDNSIIDSFDTSIVIIAIHRIVSTCERSYFYIWILRESTFLKIIEYSECRKWREISTISKNMEKYLRICRDYFECFSKMYLRRMYSTWTKECKKMQRAFSFLYMIE